MIGGREVGYTEAAAHALNAGCDMVLLCNQSVDGGAAVDELLQGLEQARRDTQWRASPVSEQRRLALLPATPGPDWEELMRSDCYLRALGELQCLSA